MFFYDNLLSGAGYSSQIGNILPIVFSRAKEILDCDCDKSCRHCLDNFWNQRKHYLLDRKLALQLLDWAMNDKEPMRYTLEQKRQLLTPLRKLFNDVGEDFTAVDDSYYYKKCKIEKVYNKKTTPNEYREHYSH